MILVIFDIFNRADGGFDDFAADAYRWITHVVGQVFLVWALLLYVLWQISQVNVKCKRLPAMFSTLNFGIEIDHDRSVVVNHIIASDVGLRCRMSRSPASLSSSYSILFSLSPFRCSRDWLVRRRAIHRWTMRCQTKFLL